MKRFPFALVGWGLAVIAIIAVATVAFAAIVITTIYLWHRTNVNNRLMRDLCQKAQDEGRDAVVQSCIEATRDLQQETVTSQVGSVVLKVALAVAAMYVGGKYVLPYVVDQFEKRKR